MPFYRVQIEVDVVADDAECAAAEAVAQLECLTELPIASVQQIAVSDGSPIGDAVEVDTAKL